MRSNDHDCLREISKLRPEEQLRLVEVITTNLRGAVRQPGKKRSILELEGLGADLWRKLDVETYIRQERDSWD